ncbi:hypothetical protein ACK3ZF_12525 [Aeromonas caviae]
MLTASLIPGLKLSLALAIHYAQHRPLHAHNGRRTMPCTAGY